MTLKRIFLIASLIYTGLIVLLNVRLILSDNLILYFIPLIILFALVYLLTPLLKIKDIYFCILLFILSFTLKSILVTVTYGDPVSDFSLFYKAAKSVAAGDFSFSATTYFSTWSYQTGIVLYYGLLMKLLGTGLLPLLLVNCAYMAGVNLFIYLIAGNYTEQKYARAIAVLYLLYPGSYFLAPVLTNQHVSNLCIIAGIYLISNRIASEKAGSNIVRSALSGLLIALGNIMRPQGIVIIVSLLVFIIFNVVSYIRIKDTGFIKNAAILVIVYFLISSSASFIVSATNINKNGLKNNYPLWKFVVGFNYESKGAYSRKDSSELFNIKDTDKRDRLSGELIAERISDPVRLVKLMYYKNKKMWSQYDTLEWGFSKYKGKDIDIFGHNVPFSSISTKVLILERVYYLFVLVIAWLGVFTVLRRQRDKDFDALLFLILVLMTYIGMHCLIEVQERYRDFALIFIFILGSKGLSSVASGMKFTMGRLLERKETNL